MRKSVCFLILFLSLFELAIADTIGLRAGIYADSPDVLADSRQFFLTPQIEYKHTFGNFDIYARGEYTFNLTALYPQFLFAEERIAAHLPLGSRSEFQLRLFNEDDFRFNPDKDDGRGGGRVKPELSYGLFLPPGEISLALGSPLTYPLWNEEDILFGLDVTAGYITPFWLGFEAAANFITVPAAGFDGMKFAVNYAGDQFYGELAFRARESFSYFTLKAEFDYSFDFFILWGTLEAGNLANASTLSLGAAVGIKYCF
ncbi:MAG: hypothetical protein LBB83_05150 [Treponema sp.]|nr:hypothetical protein [Treponema sp.]